MAALTAGLALAISHAPSHAQENEAADQAVKVEDTPGSEVKTLTFTQDAMDRLGIDTGAVREFDAMKDGVKARHRAVPHSAVTYDSEGRTWVYVSPGPDVFVRKPITIEFMDDAHVYISTGPAIGELVATTGVPEMVGAEFGVGEGE
jgi:hypothetical protein